MTNYQHGDSIKLTVDKFIFTFPKNLKYSDAGLWIRQEGSLARIGLSDFAQQRNGDIAFAKLPASGSVLASGDEIVSIETVKVNISLPSPMKGRIVDVNSSLFVSEILGTAANGCSRSSRGASQADKEAVWTVAEHIAAEVDRILLAEAPNAPSAEANPETGCACSRPVAGGNVTVGARTITIPGLQLIFEQCVKRSVPCDESGSTALLDVVRIYHRILPEEEAEYRVALLSAYRKFTQAK